MAPLQDLIGHLDEILKPRSFSDYAPNGLQVPGPTEITTVVTGVSAHAELFERAAEAGADLVLVHHGLFWRGQPLEIGAAMHRRLKLLFDNEMALAAYHLPLDAHPEHGNNALIAACLGCDDIRPFAEHEGHAIGVRGRFAGEGIGLDTLVARVREMCGGREPLCLGFGPDPARSIGIVSGAAADYATEAITLGLDAFLTGEPAERSYGAARDNAISFIAAGHHATETFGVRRLGELLHARFGVEHVFIDVVNPI